VSFATANGTAIAGSDYTATSGKVAIPTGATHAIFTVPVLQDPIIEPNETFQVTFTNPRGGTLATPHAIATIIDGPTVPDDDATCTKCFPL
jgi:hypothetical protein